MVDEHSKLLVPGLGVGGRPDDEGAWSSSQNVPKPRGRLGDHRRQAGIAHVDLRVRSAIGRQLGSAGPEPLDRHWLVVNGERLDEARTGATRDLLEVLDERRPAEELGDDDVVTGPKLRVGHGQCEVPGEDFGLVVGLPASE